MHPIIFLHGFLGDKEDWDPILARLMGGFALSLPYEDVVESTYQDLAPFLPCHLVGYSMGGRVAMQLKEKYPDSFLSLVILSAHPGLRSQEEKSQQLEQDLKWVEKLETLPLATFFQEWYAQPLFNTFSPSSELLARRLKKDPQLLARQLKEMTLAKQNYIAPLPGTLYLYGERDLKYANLYNPLFYHFKIEGSGHVLHLENPDACAKHIYRHQIRKV